MCMSRRLKYLIEGRLLRKKYIRSKATQEILISSTKTVETMSNKKSMKVNQTNTTAAN